MLKAGLFGWKLDIPILGDQKSTITRLMGHTDRKQNGDYALSVGTLRSHKAWKSGSHATELEGKDR